MLAWMDDEAERLTRETGEAWFWSRSREELWRKGETSGNMLHVEECATTATATRCSCACGRRARVPHRLGVVLRAGALADRRRALAQAARRLVRRKAPRDGVAACARKVGEEAVETVTAALAESDERLVEESADLFFHLYVLLASRGIDLARVDEELARRAG